MSEHDRALAAADYHVLHVEAERVVGELPAVGEGIRSVITRLREPG